MLPNKKQHQKVKTRLHPRNPHNTRYDLDALTSVCPDLKAHITLNKFGDHTVDFANPEAVMLLNKALLKQHYAITSWEIPENYLCPPIPGRADYIHHAADLLSQSNFGVVPTGNNITVLDIGVGANCIYPIIGTKEYNWTFIGSDTDETAVESAQKIVASNAQLTDSVTIKFQPNETDMYYGIITKKDTIDLVISNPPFHASAQEAKKGSLRKWKNLQKETKKDPVLNFGGQNKELWFEGGEREFISHLVRQSRPYGQSCLWFSTLVSKQSNVRNIHQLLQHVGAETVKVIPMGQGNKTSRIIAWTFQTKAQHKEWKYTNWENSSHINIIKTKNE